MSQPRPLEEPPWRAIVACAGAGLALMVLGAFVSYVLVGLGAALVVVAPLAYAVRQVRRHALYIPEERRDPYADDFKRLVDQIPLDTPREPRRPNE